MTYPLQKVRFTVEQNISSYKLELIGQQIIKKIIENTQQGRDKNGNSFTKYRGEKKGAVDLTESEDMLNALEYRVEGNDVVVGYFAHGEQNAKAHGHITGQGTNVKRDFLGLPQNEVNEIIEDNIGQTEKEARVIESVLSSLLLG